jgi:hypothetical protein
MRWLKESVKRKAKNVKLWNSTVLRFYLPTADFTEDLPAFAESHGCEPVDECEKGNPP